MKFELRTAVSIMDDRFGHLFHHDYPGSRIPRRMIKRFMAEFCAGDLLAPDEIMKAKVLKIPSIRCRGLSSVQMFSLRDTFNRHMAEDLKWEGECGHAERSKLDWEIYFDSRNLEMIVQIKLEKSMDEMSYSDRLHFLYVLQRVWVNLDNLRDPHYSLSTCLPLDPTSAVQGHEKGADWVLYFIDHVRSDYEWAEYFLTKEEADAMACLMKSDHYCQFSKIRVVDRNA